MGKIPALWEIAVTSETHDAIRRYRIKHNRHVNYTLRDAKDYYLLGSANQNLVGDEGLIARRDHSEYSDFLRKGVVGNITLEDLEKLISAGKQMTIGYHLIKDEYSISAIVLGKLQPRGWDNFEDQGFDFGKDICLKVDNPAVELLRTAGVLDLWFETIEIDEPEYPITYANLVVGEVYVTEAPAGKFIFRFGHKIHLAFDADFTKVKKTEGNHNPKNGFTTFRLATEEEKEKLLLKLPEIDGHIGHIKDDRIVYGCQDFGIKEFIKFFKTLEDMKVDEAKLNGRRISFSSMKKVYDYLERNEITK